MKTLTQQEPWLTVGYPTWLCILRIAFGAFITFKGIFYMFNIGNYEALPFYGMDPLVDVMFFHLVIFMHFVAGIFIALGFRTRVMVLSQLPIFLIALTMINSQSRLIIWNPTTELIVLTACLAMSVVYLIYGSGRFSVDKMESGKKL